MRADSAGAVGWLVDALRNVVGSERVAVDRDTRETASRDYAWMSPILRAALPDRIADVVVRPTAAQVPAVLALAHRHRVPVTPRGRGTGNYGQAVPLEGGLVLDLAGCDTIRAIGPAADGDPVADVEAGVTFAALERAAEPHGWEVAVMPSMTGSTVGGFLSGGNQGIGSIAHGSIWDGWVRELDVAGCAPDPTTFTVRGDDVAQHLHTYGTGGVITGARLALAPRVARTVVFAAFGDLPTAAAAGRALMDLTPAPRVVSVADPAVAAVLPAHTGVEPGATLLRIAIGVGEVRQAAGLIASHAGRVTAIDADALNSLYASIYNHATLRALRVDPGLCALQVRGPAIFEHLDEVRAALPGARLHLDGNAPAKHGKGYSGLLLSTWVDAATLQAGEQRLRQLGVIVISPHTWLLGGHGNLDGTRALAARVDPSGLLNPGKLPAAVPASAPSRPGHVAETKTSYVPARSSTTVPPRPSPAQR